MTGLVAFAVGIACGAQSVSSMSVHGDHLAAVSYGAVPATWDLSTGRRLKSFPYGGARRGLNAYFETIQFSPDGRLLAVGNSTASDPGYAPVWDAASGRERFKLELSSDPFAPDPVIFSLDGSFVLGYDYTGTAAFWNMQTGQRTMINRPDINGHPPIRTPSAVAGPWQREFLLLDLGSGNLRILHPPRGASVAGTLGHPDDFAIGDKGMIFDERRLALIGLTTKAGRSKLRFARITSGGILERSWTSKGSFKARDFRSAAVLENSGLLALGSDDGKIDFVDLKTGKRVRTLSVGRAAPIGALAIAHHGQWLVARVALPPGPDRLIVLDLRSGKKLRQIRI